MTRSKSYLNILRRKTKTVKAMWRLIIFLGCIISRARSECPDAWVTFQGSCYLFAHDTKTFTEAEHFCIQRGTHLVHIETEAENLFLKSFCRELRTHNYWIGLSDSDIEGIWKWKDNDAVMTYKDFYPGEPSSGHVQNCAVLWAAYDFRWGDLECTAQCMPICERKSVLPQDLVG